MRDHYDRMLQAVASEHEKIREELVTVFWPMHGTSTGRKLLLVGRAVNGWDDGIAPKALAVPEVRAEAIERAIRGSAGQGGRDPMLWISDPWVSPAQYNVKRSSFWAITEAAVGQLGLADTSSPDWPNSLDWTNLFKVSPARERNPSAGLERAQTPECRDLLALEVESTSASAILFLTGIDWAGPFLPSLESVELPSSNRFVQHAGLLHRPAKEPVPVLIAKHPERKPRDPYKKEMADAWSRLKESR